ncbi:MAG: SDR family NAD(P)-dependent oxidoreductase [Bacteroidetes bacterium]|nr:MAG: SDR family NAD(P)-dependent oxidoreductase [Bacteroidota bacterium]
MSKLMLVTGAGGFIGSHVTEALLAAGHQVRALVPYRGSGAAGWLDHLPRPAELEVFRADIRDRGRVEAAMQGVDTVFHLAALITIPYSYLAPESYLDTNVRGTLNVLEAARRLETSRVLITSTSEVYGTAQYVPMDEQHPLSAQSPYAASKIAADQLALSFHASYGVPVTLVRPFNAYGPRQSPRALIPSLIRQLLAQPEAIHLGNTRPTRDFTYVTDTAAAFLAIAAEPATIGQTLHVASGLEISVGELAQRLIDRLHPPARIEIETRRQRPSQSEVMRLLGSSAQLQALCGWQSKVSLAEGLDRTIAWMQNPAHRAVFGADRYLP